MAEAGCRKPRIPKILRTRVVARSTSQSSRTWVRSVVEFIAFAFGWSGSPFLGCDGLREIELLLAGVDSFAPDCSTACDLEAVQESSSQTTEKSVREGVMSVRVARPSIRA